MDKILRIIFTKILILIDKKVVNFYIHIYNQIYLCYNDIVEEYTRGWCRIAALNGAVHK